MLIKYRCQVIEARKMVKQKEREKKITRFRKKEYAKNGFFRLATRLFSYILIFFKLTSKIVHVEDRRLIMGVRLPSQHIIFPRFLPIEKPLHYYKLTIRSARVAVLGESADFFGIKIGERWARKERVKKEGGEERGIQREQDEWSGRKLRRRARGTSCGRVNSEGERNRQKKGKREWREKEKESCTRLIRGEAEWHERGEEEGSGRTAGGERRGENVTVATFLSPRQRRKVESTSLN